MSAVLIPYEALRAWCASILQTAGVSPQAAQVTSRYMLRTDARGVRTHGVTRLASYLDKLNSGEVNAVPDLRIAHDGSGIILQADGALGQVAMQLALEQGLERLREQSMVAVRIQACGHLGALGIYALEAAEQGAFCLLAQRTPALMGLPGFDAPVIGNNPFAYASPVAGGAPLVFDMACSVAARGHILLKARQGESIPPGWALDEQGRPTTDAQQALRGSLLPSAQHKGMGLAMLVECLAGGMAAGPDSIAALDQPAQVPTAGAMGRQSAFMLLLDPQKLGQGLFDDYMSSWTQTYRHQGGESARLPGERGAGLEAQVQESGLLSVHASLYDELAGLGAQRGLPVPDACLPLPSSAG